jgi:SAM-dependent methyltransferase
MSQDEASDQTPSLLRDLLGWYSFVLLGLGMRTGLLDALVAGPGTAAELAARAGVDERNAFEWLRGVTAAGHALHQDGSFSLSPETELQLSPHFPVDMRAVVDVTLEAPAVFDDVVDAVRSGAGVPPSAYAAVSAAGARINTPTYAAALVQEWIPLAHGMSDRLRAGGSVADLAAGNGDAAALVAAAFPASRVFAYDLMPTTRTEAPENLTLRVADVRELPDDGPFDLVYCLDAFHHLGDPAPMLLQARSVLAPDGVLMIAETGMSGDLDQDVAEPLALIAYGAGLMYCLQESLSTGGGGYSGGDGTQWVVDALSQAGFSSIEVSHSPTGYAVITASPGSTA